MKVEVQKQKKTKKCNVKKELLKNDKGITLIALVITIIILLILAGVAIATLTGENGLFARAKQAKQTQTESEMKEKLNLSIQELQVEKLTEATLDDITQEWLTQKLSEYNPILKEDGTTNSKKVTLQKNGVIKLYMIDEKLNITEVENGSGIEFSYEIVKRENGKVKILIKVQDSENGINKVEVPGDAIILKGTREQRGIDQEIEVGTEYTYKVISVSGKEREETILIEPEIIVGDAYIGTSTTKTDSTKSVVDNSQTRGTKLYINFTATLEKFGTSACTVKLKGGADSDTLPYAITKNGTYTFVVTGTYGEGKTITKEVEVKVNKYEATKWLVQYDAGNWTEDEINALKVKKLYNINTAKKASGNEELKFTFGGFTYKEDSSGNANTTYANEISNGTVITSRNQSVVADEGYSKPTYEGWQILEIQDSARNKITNEIEISNKLENLSSGEKVYVTKLVHAGSPENFVYYTTTTSHEEERAEYILSGGTRQTSYNTYQPRDWSMYEDTNLKAKGYIDEVHAMTYDEALAITGSANHTNGLRKIKASYWLASCIRYTNSMRCIQYGGDIVSNHQRCFGVRPVVSLVAGVYITGGDGTEGNEYVLGKE